VLLNQGGGAFALAGTAPVDGSPASMAAADLDGDGKPDIAVAVPYDTVDVLSNQGGGALSAPVAHHASTIPPLPMIPVGMQPQAIAAADLDGDGKPDIAVLEYDDQNVAILHNQGDGAFAAAIQISLSPRVPYDIAAADVDGDGAPDLLVALFGDGTLDAGGVAVLRNKGDGTFEPPVYVPAGAHPWAIHAADLNGDGKPDIAVVSPASTLTVVLNQGDGTFGSAAEIQTGSMPTTIASADFDHDGLGDLAITDGPVVNVFLNQGGGSFGPATSYPATGGAESIVAADFDGDGWADLAVGTGGGTLMILKNQHDGTFVASYAAGTGKQAVAVDLNGDGAPDLVFPGNGVTVVMNQGGGTFAAPVSYGAGDGPDAVAAADLNGDGRPDLAVADFDGNTVSVLIDACLP
jgi:hypothetical protein